MKIIAGEYEGKALVPLFGKLLINTGFLKQIEIQDQIVKYEIIDEQKQKSLRSALVRGAIGGSLFGPIGTLAGALTAKDDETRIVDLTLENGKHILVECGDASEYNKFLKIILKYITKRNDEWTNLDLGSQEEDEDEWNF
jgi:hypothetical protein